MPRKRAFTDEECKLIRESGIPYRTFYERVVKRGMPFEEALKKPLTRFPITPEQRKKAKENGIDMKVVYNRHRLGWTMEQAITIPVNAHITFTPEILEKAAANGICRATLQSRFYVFGWDLEKCINTPVNSTYGKGDRWTK